uniref:Integrase catalytic domain-containing protein n=1 Tax=Tanacetum cinerariifolium TaxID=118510 RepID=A0A6L2MDY9_TANCI|nr:hypothetical protein [Tanacetum cinerariifolium]
MVSMTTSLTGFSGETIWPLGQLRLLVTIEDAKHYTRAWMNFMIVRSPSPYNGIIGRPGIREIQTVPSTAHGMLKFPVNREIMTIRSTILMLIKCITIAETPKDQAKKAEARHKIFKVVIHPDFSDQEITIGGTVSIKARTKLCTLLKRNLDIFAWQPSDMTGVPRSIAEHRLNIREGYFPVRQKKRWQAPERAKAIQVEKSIGRSNPFAATPLSVSWTPRKAIIKYRWPNKMRKKRLSTLVTGRRNVSRIHDKSERDKTVPRQDGGCVTAPIPRSIKEDQSLNGKLASLNRFISKSAKKSLPLFKTLKKCIKKSDFHWTPGAKQTFKQLKQHLSKLPMLLAPKPKEELIMYLYASYGAISAVLMTERDTVQTPVYFILADFLVEKPDDAPPEASMIETPQDPYTLFTDGSSCVDGSGAGLILTSPEGTEFTYTLKFQFTASNNEAEYEALIAGLRIAAQMGVRNVHNEASKLCINARQYELLEGVLYRRSFLKPWLRCVGPLQADYVIREIHEGSCSMHAGPRSVVAKAMRLGYYWPTMHRDARDLIRTCNACQVHRQRKIKFLIVAMDYFTTWIEAKAVATITGSQVKKFVWDNIVCRFGLPGEIVLDNHKQLSDNPFKDWCEKLNITQRFASVTHPQSNRLVERAKRSLEIKMPTYRTVVVDAVHNNEELRLNLDLLEERHECAAIREAKAKLKMTKYYNTRVRGVTFRHEDFVYRSNEASHAMDGGKLGLKWEGPYEVTEALEDEAYRLRSMDGTVLPRT